MEQFDWNSMVDDPAVPLFRQPSQPQQMRMRAILVHSRIKGLLQERGRVLAHNINSIPQPFLGYAADDLRGSCGIVSVNEEVCSSIEEFGTVPCYIGHANDL